jgi:hypothetical protein
MEERANGSGRLLPRQARSRRHTSITCQHRLLAGGWGRGPAEPPECGSWGLEGTIAQRWTARPQAPSIHLRIRPVKPPDVIPVPALRLVRLPTQPGHQAVGESEVGRVADDRIGNSASAAAGCNTANIDRPHRGHDSAVPAAAAPAATRASASVANARPATPPPRSR